MAACGAEASWIRYSSTRDATCEGGVIGNDGEDRSQGCARACPADPDGLVPSGARQIDGLAGGASTVGCAQAASRAAYRRRIEHSWNPARLWSEGRRCDAQGPAMGPCKAKD